jgi:hypothetical protein
VSVIMRDGFRVSGHVRRRGGVEHRNLLSLPE